MDEAIRLGFSPAHGLHVAIRSIGNYRFQIQYEGFRLVGGIPYHYEANGAFLTAEERHQVKKILGHVYKEYKPGWKKK